MRTRACSLTSPRAAWSTSCSIGGHFGYIAGTDSDCSARCTAPLARGSWRGPARLHQRYSPLRGASATDAPSFSCASCPPFSGYRHRRFTLPYLWGCWGAPRRRGGASMPCVGWAPRDGGGGRLGVGAALRDGWPERHLHTATAWSERRHCAAVRFLPALGCAPQCPGHSRTVAAGERGAGRRRPLAHRTPRGVRYGRRRRTGLLASSANLRSLSSRLFPRRRCRRRHWV